MKSSTLPIAALLTLAPIYASAQIASPAALGGGLIEYLETTRRCSLDLGRSDSGLTPQSAPVQLCVRDRLQAALKFYDDMEKHPPANPVLVPVDVADAERRCQDEQSLGSRPRSPGSYERTRTCATARLTAALARTEDALSRAEEPNIAAVVTSALKQAEDARAQAAEAQRTPLVVATPTADLAGCRRAMDSAERLRCYDALANAAAPAQTGEPGDYASIDLAEFKSDRASLVGQAVELTGNLLPKQGFAVLQSSPGDQSAIFVNLDTAQRNQRIDAYRRCGQGCEVVVRGRVSQLPIGALGVIADTVEIR